MAEYATALTALSSTENVSVIDRLQQRDEEYKAQRAALAKFLDEGLEPGQQWFFWCLKAPHISEYTKEQDGWAWPPRLSGRIAAADKNDARKRLAEEFGEPIPMRVLVKDYGKHPFLLYIEPMSIGSSGERYARRFIPTQCKECGTTFTLNDKYNDPHANSNAHACSSECEALLKAQERAMSLDARAGYNTPVIYCITHKPTGQKYVGKTEQPFTLRWYQHMYHPGDSDFHALVRQTPVTDWQFEVLEHLGYLLVKHDNVRGANYRLEVAQREQYWINTLNTLDQGLNSVKATAMPDEPDTPIEGGDNDALSLDA